MGVPSSGEPPTPFELAVLVAALVGSAVFAGSAIVLLAGLALNW